jgi:hypothetical protein
VFFHVGQGGFCFFQCSGFKHGFRRKVELFECTDEVLPVYFSGADIHVLVFFACVVSRWNRWRRTWRITSGTRRLSWANHSAY